MTEENADSKDQESPTTHQTASEVDQSQSQKPVLKILREDADVILIKNSKLAASKTRNKESKDESPPKPAAVTSFDLPMPSSTMPDNHLPMVPMQMIKKTVSLLLILATLAGCDQQSQPATGQPLATPVALDRVLDGDTFNVATGGDIVGIRLVGIDCPERKQRFGSEATAMIASLVDGKEIRIIEHGTERYGRTLGDVYADGVWVNQALVRNGLAWHYEKYSDDPRLAEAQAERIGIWSDEKWIAPWDYRNGVRIETAIPVNAESIRESDTVVYVTSGGRKYHREDCHFVTNGGPLPLSRAGAYEPCKVCKPQLQDSQQ